MKRSTPLYVMLILPILWYILFCYIPMSGLIIAFKDYSLFKGVFASPWIGLEHFKRFLTDEYFWKILGNTVRLGTLNLIFVYTAPIILAILINEIRSAKFKKITQTVTYLPHFVSMAALVNIVIIMLSPSSGIINNIINAFGGNSINFMVEYQWFPVIYILTILWRDTGWGTIIYLAAISGVNPELYDVADLDGAGRLQKIWNITIPAMLPVISIMFILTVPGILGADFETVMLLQRNVTYETSDVVATYIFRRGILNGEFDYATAITLVFSLVGVAVLLITNSISKKISDNGIW